MAIQVSCGQPPFKENGLIFHYVALKIIYLSRPFGAFWMHTFRILAKSCCFRQIKQGFWYFTQLRSCKFHIHPQNPTKFTKRCKIRQNSLIFVTNTMSVCIWNLSWLLGCLFASKLEIYHKPLSLLQVNNIPKPPALLD